MSHPTPKPPRKRATQRELVLRDARIFERFAAGATLEEIALRERITPRRVQERLTEIYARQAEQSPAEIAKLQTRRLGEALLVSWSAMTGGNLDAVDRVVRITREMDRYYGFSLPRLAAIQGAVRDEPLPALAPPSDATVTAKPSSFFAPKMLRRRNKSESQRERTGVTPAGDRPKPAFLP